MANEFDLVGRPYLLGSTPCIRSVCLNDHSDGRKILVGTSCSEVTNQVSMVVPHHIFPCQILCFKRLARSECCSKGSVPQRKYEDRQELAVDA